MSQPRRKTTATGFTPWTDLDEAGSGLAVDSFITTLMSQVGNALRRVVTTPYADQFGLSVSEWRVLSLIAHAEQIGFGDLVAQSASDKALVSRTLKLLENRNLVQLQTSGTTPRKKLSCRITAAGARLYADAIPIARRRQAAAIRALPREERDAMYRALVKLRSYCDDEARDGQEEEHDVKQGVDPAPGRA